MAEANNTSLKEALCAQQRLLQKLYNELDVERESSATAASEALSMILRLQGEKAAVKMEAEHYKRLAEDKMHHAEESMEIFEDLIYQKEMEIASLDYQFQAYRYKLLSLGCVDPGVGEIKFPEILLQRNETLVGETSAENIIARRNSAPPKLPKLAYFKTGTFERERSSSPETDLISKIVEENENYQNLDFLEKPPDSSSVVDINSYWEHIRKLDERVKEMAGEQYANLRGRSRSSSVFSQVSSGMGCDTKKQDIDNESLLGKEIISDSACSLSVHDVFEVPQTAASPICCERQTKDEGKLVLQGDERVRKLDSLRYEAIKSNVKGENDLGKKIIMSTHGGSSLCKPSDGIAVNCHLAIVRPAAAVAEAHAESQQMNRTTEIIECERQDLRQEPTTRGEEELKLLIEIREQLNLIQSEIRSCKTKKSFPEYDLPMLLITEAMLHFWL